MPSPLKLERHQGSRVGHRRIPPLPERPRVHPVAAKIARSYPVGRQDFSRACEGEILTLTIVTGDPLPDAVEARLMTTINATEGGAWAEIPFVRTDERTLECRVTPKRPGLHSFRSEFSLDHGATWERDTVPDAWVFVDPPQVDALRLYTLIPTVSGTIADWTADLKRIGKMGFNAVHLLPITTLDATESPYAARDLFSIDPSYLSTTADADGLAQLDAFVTEAKAQNIRLCFDLVLNHVGVQSLIAQRAPDWIMPDQNRPDGLKRARYWMDGGWRLWEDLVLINYEHPSEAIRAEIRAYMIDYALFWAKYANDTGGFVRFDNLHSSDSDFVEALTQALHAEYPAVGVLAEYFADDQALLTTGSKWGLNLVLATSWNYKFVPALRDYLKYLHRVSEHIRYFMPITSHDSGAPAQEFGTSDSTVPRYVAAALLGTGATGIPQGVEFGEKERINFIGRQPKMNFPAEAKFSVFIGQVNAVLAGHAVFRHGGNCQFIDDAHPSIIAAFRRDIATPTSCYLVVCNFDTRNPQRIHIDLSSELGTDGPLLCHELLSGAMQNYPNPHLDLELPPCGAQVLSLAKRDTGKEGR